MASNSDKALLRQAFKRVEGEVPERLARLIRKLRHPDARWVRVPAGLALILGGVFSVLPVLGLWMLPVGLLLIAFDVPFLRVPMARFTICAAEKWSALRQRFVGREQKG